MIFRTVLGKQRGRAIRNPYAGVFRVSVAIRPWREEALVRLEHTLGVEAYLVLIPGPSTAYKILNFID